MSLVKKVTISLSTAIIISATSAFALETTPPSVDTAEQKKSQLQEQKAGYCWVYVNGQWIYIC